MDKNNSLLWPLLLLSLCAEPLWAATPRFDLANTARYLGGKSWHWTIFVKAAPEVLAQIDCVEYSLHPTFKEPDIKVCEAGAPEQAFAYSAQGWGTFDVKARVRFKDAQESALKHTLVFNHEVKASEALSVRGDNSAQKTSDGLWKWRVFIRAPSNALEKIQCVKYVLDDSFPDPEREVCNAGKGEEAFVLDATSWAPFDIEIQVLLKNGGIQRLKHSLKFE